jgi:hypothetical protein
MGRLYHLAKRAILKLPSILRETMPTRDGAFGERALLRKKIKSRLYNYPPRPYFLSRTTRTCFSWS